MFFQHMAFEQLKYIFGTIILCRTFNHVGGKLVWKCSKLCLKTKHVQKYMLEKWFQCQKCAESEQLFEMLYQYFVYEWQAWLQSHQGLWQARVGTVTFILHFHFHLATSQFMFANKVTQTFRVSAVKNAKNEIWG